MKKKNGFTLIETLVVLSIIGFIFTMGLNFFSSMIKGNTKTNILGEIKQNGSYAMDVMSFYIRNATNIVSCSSETPSTITLRQWDGTNVIFSLLSKDDTNQINARIASNSSALTSGDKDEGVNVTDLIFTCSNTTIPTVTINFTIAQSGWLPNKAEYNTSVPFTTVVALRSY